MVTFARRAAHWVGAHALATTAAAVVLIGATGGGIGYELAGQHASGAATKPVAAAQGTTPAPTKPGAAAGTAPGHAAAIVQRALQALATETGQTPEQVRSELEAGKSINDIAGSKAAAMETSVITAITKLADKAVSAGKITPAQEAAGLATAKTKISALMAEPGTQLLKDVQQLIQFLQKHPHSGAIPSPGATPAA